MTAEEDGDPYASGFEFSRRALLATGVAIGLAGCGSDSDPETTSPTSVETNTPSPTPAEEVEDPAGPDLTVVDSGFVSKQDGLENYFRVRVRNELESETMSSVGIMIEFFDPDLRFLEQQNATISYLGPKEVFEGYVTYYNDDAVAWAVRTARTRRSDSLERITGLSVSDHCIDDQEVRGVVENNGGQSVRRLVVQVAFYDDDGDRVGTGSQSLTDLAAGGSAAFEVDFNDVIGDPTVSVSDYSVSVGDIGDELLSIR